MEFLDRDQGSGIRDQGSGIRDQGSGGSQRRRSVARPGAQRSTELERKPAGGGPRPLGWPTPQENAGRRSGFWPQLAVSRFRES